MAASSFTTTDEIIAVYKTPAEHTRFIENLEDTFPDDYKSLGIKPDINNRIYFKITNKKENHRGIQYHDGLVSDTQQVFNPSGCCSGGGLYFTTLENLHMFGHFGNNIRPIIVPGGVPIYDEVCTAPTRGHFQCPKYHYKSKAPTVYVLPKIKLGSEESIKLLYNPTHNSNNLNNRFIMSRMYLSDTLSYLNLYREYYNDKYRYAEGNIYGVAISTKYGHRNPSPYTKRRKFHPEHKQLIHCKVKDLIINEQYASLFDLIYEKKTLLEWFYQKSSNKLFQDRAVSISELFYIFLKHQDKAFLRFMKNQYLPRFQLLQSEGCLQQQVVLDLKQSIQNIQTNIKTLIDKNIYDIILKYGGIISGSFALKHFIGADWQCDDIDIYLPALECNNINKYIVYDLLLSEIRDSTKNIVTYIGDSNSYNMSNIVEIINIEQLNGTKLQFIFTKVDPFEFIKDNFDFDFCKVCFRLETETFESNSAGGAAPIPPTARAAVGIASPLPPTARAAVGIAGRIDQAYMDKISKWNMDDSYSVYRAAKTMDRITKYMARGFTITNLDEFFDCLEKLFD